MPDEPNRILHARFILGAAKSVALAQVRIAGENAIDRDKFVGWALPNAFFAIAALRMALEYVAYDLQQQFLPGTERDSAFPICDDLHSFESVMGSRFPGLKERRRDVWEALLRMQPFSEGDYPTLKVLNELWHHSKHVDLGETTTSELVMIIENPTEGTREEVRKYLLFFRGNRPLLDLLDQCIKDVAEVISTVESLIRGPTPTVAPETRKHL